MTQPNSPRGGSDFAPEQTAQSGLPIQQEQQRDLSVAPPASDRGPLVRELLHQLANRSSKPGVQRGSTKE